MQWISNNPQRERRYMHAGPAIRHHLPLDVHAAPTLASLPSRFASNRSKMRLTLSWFSWDGIEVPASVEMSQAI